jgi:signal transduction histidine kinase
VDDVLVSIDATKFSQVIRNLLSNALKFTPKGGKVTVTCSTIPMNHKDFSVHFAEVPSGIKERYELNSLSNLHGFVRIHVHDTGVGISSANQIQMFKEFTQFNPDKLQNGQGSGLGLWSKILCFSFILFYFI